MMDLRRPLFHLEQLSPGLARKLWSLTPWFNAPMTLALGFKVKTLSDLVAEVEIPYGPQNRNERGMLHPSVLIAGGEFAALVLWKRHLNPELEEVRLSRIECEFLKNAVSPVRVRVELLETEREKVLRLLRLGEECEHEMAMVLLDERDQTLASFNTRWSLKPLRPLALGQGRT